MENRQKCGDYYFNYINNKFKCGWPKYTNEKELSRVDNESKTQLNVFYRKPTFKQWIKIYHANTNHKKAKVAILIVVDINTLLLVVNSSNSQKISKAIVNITI